jgi:calmodulin
MEEISDIKLKEYREAFDMFDKDHNGKITLKELGHVMKSLNQEPTESELKEMISEVDIDGNGEIDFEEFVTLMNNRAKESDTEEEIIQAFRVFDHEGKGHISRIELKFILSSMTDRLSDDYIERMIEEADLQGTGIINYEYFVRRMMSK